MKPCHMHLQLLAAYRNFALYSISFTYQARRLTGVLQVKLSLLPADFKFVKGFNWSIPNDEYMRQ